MAVAESIPAILKQTTQVFEEGRLSTRSFHVEKSHPASPPKPLLVVSPAADGAYPLLLFLHGTSLSNAFYSLLLHHVSSHGFIVVAPQLYSLIPPSGATEIDAAAAVADWLPAGLPSILPDKVLPTLHKLAVAGHSRGGKAAFSMVLGHAASKVTFSALIGVDPVAGSSSTTQIKPKLLTYVPASLDLGVPVAVVGTGLGSEPRSCLAWKACAPDGVSHEEFFRECRPPCAHFVAAEYGHMDVLDDAPPGVAGKVSGCLCKNGKGPRELARRGVGGIMVAFLRACLDGEDSDLKAILADPTVAPIKLDPLEFIPRLSHP